MGTLISSNELSFLQQLVEETFDQSCQVQDKTTNDDGYGQFTEAWSTIATINVGVALPKSSLLAAYAERIGSLATWLVKFPLGTIVVKEQQHLIITDGQGNSQTLVVQALLSPRSYELYLGALASEVR